MHTIYNAKSHNAYYILQNHIMHLIHNPMHTIYNAKSHNSYYILQNHNAFNT